MRKFLQFLLVCMVLGLPLTAQTSYILTASPSNMQNVVNQHGLTIVKELYDGTNCVMLVTSASADVAGTETEVESDIQVLGFEPEQRASLPELTGLTQPTLRVPGDGVLDLDDVGAPFAEHRARRRDESVHRDFEDADALERPHESAPETTSAKVLDSRNSSSPALPISLPMPDCL